MSVSLTISVGGLDAITAALDQYGNSVVAAVKEGVAEAALSIQNDARVNAPVDTGYLRSQIQVELVKDGLGAFIESNAEYSAFVEFGTGRRGSNSSGTGPLPSDYEYGSKVGNSAQPFLWPAFQKGMGEFVGTLESKIAEVWR